jgi:hypothetical protein
MAHGSLLRHIFRHGPHSKSQNSAVSLTNSSALMSETKSTAPDALLASQQCTLTCDAPESPLTKKTRLGSQDSSRTDSRASILDELAGGERSDVEASISGVASDDGFMTATLDTLKLDTDLQTLTTRELLIASINEAKMATHAHLNTIRTTLGLLDALSGLSATIVVLRDDMLESIRECEERFGMLENLERMLR